MGNAIYKVKYNDTDIYSVKILLLRMIFVTIFFHGSDEVKVEDVLNSLLCMWALDIAQVSHLVASSRNIPRIYFSGSFITREEIRSLITKELTQREGVYRVSCNTLSNNFIT